MQLLQVELQLLEQVHLLRRSQQRYNVRRCTHSRHFHKALSVKIDEGSHYQLAVHTVAHSSMSRNRITEILHK